LLKICAKMNFFLQRDKMTKVKITSWNINSVRLRINIVKDYLKLHAPDILCLQEIKCQNHEFPKSEFEELGYKYFSINGQKGWHGVAIVSKIPIKEIIAPDFCKNGHSRIIAVQIGENGPILHNLYVPAGGDEPDPEINDKFAHKLDFLAKMEEFYKNNQENIIVVGDLNIAPHENDVWSHKALLNVVSHTPIETQTLERLRIGGNLIDIARYSRDESDKLFTWWSYRSPDWTKNDRGRRLDHIWVSENIIENVDLNSFAIYRDARAWEKPSDHVPICVELNI
jgi:exodeoxyribonuclease III